MTPEPLRVFRADAPQEVASAAIVAGELSPGRNVLAVYAGGSYGSAEAALEALKAMAHTHPWAGVVDLTDLPVKGVGTAVSTGRERLARTRAMVRTVRGMRERVGAVLGMTADEVARSVDEVYISVLTSGTMVSAYALSDSASICCYPHTLTSVTGLERYQLDYPRSWAGSLADLGKRVIWGREALSPRHISVDLAITYWREPDWAARTMSMSHLITASTMRRLFNGLPQEVRSYFEGIADDCGEAASLLLLAPGDTAPNPDQQAAVEEAAYLRLAARLIEGERATSLIVKPHPRMRPQRVEQVTDALRASFPQTPIVVPLRFPSLPAEVIAAPIKLAACGAIISSSLCTLPLLYRVRSYYDQSAADSLYGAANVQRILDDWRERLPMEIVAA